jgi:dolichol kinase
MWRQVGAEHFDPFASRVIELIQKSLPHHHKKDVYWRYHFMVCTIFAALSDTEPENRLARLSLGVADASNEDEFSTQMIRFLLNVFEGP